MANEKLLILESCWSEGHRYRLTDRRSTTAIYKAGLDAINIGDRLVTLTRPLISANFVADMDSFLSLPANRKGINVIILSGHGQKFQFEDDDGELVLTKSIAAYDGQVTLLDIEELMYSMSRTILILDCCTAGEHIHKLFRSTDCFGIIAFASEVIWLDSTLFLQNMLLRFLIYGVFSMKQRRKDKVEAILKNMQRDGYKALMDKMKLRWKLRKQPC